MFLFARGLMEYLLADLSERKDCLIYGWAHITRENFPSTVSIQLEGLIWEVLFIKRGKLSWQYLFFKNVMQNSESSNIFLHCAENPISQFLVPNSYIHVSFLGITRPSSFISENTSTGTRHLLYIGFSLAPHLQSMGTFINKKTWMNSKVRRNAGWNLHCVE